SGCHGKPTADQEVKTPYVIPSGLLQELRLDTVKSAPLESAVNFTGVVDFDQDHQVNIYPLVSGVIQEVKVQLGDFVRSGQVLAVVKSSEMANFTNNKVIAETNLKLAAKQLGVAREMFRNGLSTQLEVANATTNYEQALAQNEMAERVLKINGDGTKSDYVIRAPISGCIVQKNITNNTSIRQDNNLNLFTVSDLKTVWVMANVYESNIQNVRLGAPVSISTLSYPDRLFEGKVDKIVNVLDPVTKVMKVRIQVANPDLALKPAMFASVTVTDKQSRILPCLSKEALIFDNSQYYVLKYKGSGHAEITKVSVESSFGGKVFVSSGVANGDQVIASKALLIYNNLNN
ncbi:MAG: efflux RND transporter periplasmic adaptor subunit, partial [Marinilabiliales bacterium]|nr:efflux RND transporter periplasmic adaptor subunit [Marinilabiliales bacterium]